MEKIDFRNYLKAIKDYYDITYEKLAMEIGISDRAIYSWLAGRTKPSLKTLNKLESTYHFLTDDFVKKTYACGLRYKYIEAVEDDFYFADLNEVTFECISREEAKEKYIRLLYETASDEEKLIYIESYFCTTIPCGEYQDLEGVKDNKELLTYLDNLQDKYTDEDEISLDEFEMQKTMSLIKNEFEIYCKEMWEEVFAREIQSENEYRDKIEEDKNNSLIKHSFIDLVAWNYVLDAIKENSSSKSYSFSVENLEKEGYPKKRAEDILDSLGKGNILCFDSDDSFGSAQITNRVPFISNDGNVEIVPTEALRYLAQINYSFDMGVNDTIIWLFNEFPDFYTQ